MRRKRPLKESLEDNTNGPSSSKRVRLVDAEPPQQQPEDIFSIPNRRRNRNRNQRTRQRVRRLDEFESRDGTTGPLRGKRSSEIEEKAVDENDISDLTRQFKRARLRPVLFTISTFIEQTVDDIQITVGDGDDYENSNSYEGNGEAHATFTFRLPPPRLPLRQEFATSSESEAAEASQS